MFAETFAALLVAHHVGDHWLQTDRQAVTKGAPGQRGRHACAQHVATLTLIKVFLLVTAWVVLDLRLNPVVVAAALALDAASHYWADRAAHHPQRVKPVTLMKLAQRVGKGRFAALGDRGVAPTGTGRYTLDQVWHLLWLWISALLITVGSA
jgi:Protein of unknown function (DUF3307)